MTTDTALGGPQHRFPQTRDSAISGIANADESVRRRSYQAIVAAYWKPVYKYLRLRWRESNEGAKDLAQSFFAKALETESLTRYDSSRGAFRTYIRLSVDGHVLNARKYHARAKRYGDAHPISLEIDVPSELSPDTVFHAEWVRSMLELAVEDVRQDYNDRDRSAAFRVFELYDLSEEAARPGYAALAVQFAVPLSSVTNYLSAVRRDLRKAVLARLRELTATEREFRSEARSLLGIEV